MVAGLLQLREEDTRGQAARKSYIEVVLVDVYVNIDATIALYAKNSTLLYGR